MKKKCRYRSKTSSMLSEELTRASVWGKETEDRRGRSPTLVLGTFYLFWTENLESSSGSECQNLFFKTMNKESQ